MRAPATIATLALAAIAAGCGGSSAPTTPSDQAPMDDARACLGATAVPDEHVFGPAMRATVLGTPVQVWYTPDDETARALKFTNDVTVSSSGHSDRRWNQRGSYVWRWDTPPTPKQVLALRDCIVTT